MKKNKNISDDTLRELFKGIPLEEPTQNFMDNLFQKIDAEAIKSKKIKQRWIIVGQIAAGVAGILLFPALVIYLYILYRPDSSFSFPKIYIDFNTNVLIIGFSVLMLLILDTLIRIHLANQAKNN